MVSNVQKTPIISSLNSFATAKALAKTRQLGHALPCSVVSVSGAIVTVKFEVTGTWTLPNVQMPVATSRYVREPIQVGDKGYAAAATAYLGGVSGLGGGTADLTQRGNLTALVFQPLGNSGWGPSSDPRAVVVGETSPNGVRLQDAAAAAIVTVNPTGNTLTFAGGTIAMSSSGITLSFGGHSVVINSAGVTIDGILWDTHFHGNVTPGGGNTGPPL